MREAREQAAIEIEAGLLLCTRQWPDDFVLHVFAAEIVSGERHAPPGTREVGWFDPAAPPSPSSRALETLAEVQCVI